MAASSPPPVNTHWPFFALTIAVPVSWHIGSTPPAAIAAFFSRSRATKRSLSLASGSSSTLRSWARWAGRRKWAMSCIASAVSRVIAAGSTLRNGPAGVSNVDTPVGRDQPVRRRVRSERQQFGVLETTPWQSAITSTYRCAEAHPGADRARSRSTATIALDDGERVVVADEHVGARAPAGTVRGGDGADPLREPDEQRAGPAWRRRPMRRRRCRRRARSSACDGTATPRRSARSSRPLPCTEPYAQLQVGRHAAGRPRITSRSSTTAAITHARPRARSATIRARRGAPAWSTIPRPSGDPAVRSSAPSD